MNNTDEKIQTALLVLMKEKSLEEITIMAIADYSKVNRTTVYRHYVNKLAILEAIENDILNGLDKIDQYGISEEDDRSQVLKVLESINEKRAIITILLSHNGGYKFYDSFVNFLTAKGLKTIENSHRFNGLDSRQKELLAQYISSALLGLVKYWLSHPEMSVEELDTFFEKLFRKGISSFTAQ